MPRIAITKKDVQEQFDVLKKKLIELYSDVGTITSKEVSGQFFVLKSVSSDTEKELCKVVFYNRNTNYQPGDVICVDKTYRKLGIDVCFNLINEKAEYLTEHHLRLLFDKNCVIQYESGYYKGYKQALKDINEDTEHEEPPSTGKKNVSTKVKELEDELTGLQKEVDVLKTEKTSLVNNNEELSKWFNDVRRVTRFVPPCMRNNN